MKYAILIGDGMGDYPSDELGGRTPLGAAEKGNMDHLAGAGTIGLVKTIPEGMPAGSDIAIMNILGYDPLKYYPGRAPFEAVAAGVIIEDRDVVFRMNLVTLKEGGGGNLIMDDFSAGHINSVEGGELIKVLKESLGNSEIRFFQGVSYRNLMVWRDGLDAMETTPPHDIMGEAIAGYLPKGEGAELLNELMERSRESLLEERVNKERLNRGLRPANGIWLWGQGRRPVLPAFDKKYGVHGSVISGVDLIKGMGRCMGLEPINVPGATGYLDTDYNAKAIYGLDELDRKDLVIVHVEAPDEAGHNGDIKAKVKSIEDFDRKVVGTFIKGLVGKGPARLMVLTDHYTPIPLRTHSPEPVPFMIVDTEGIDRKSYPSKVFHERARDKGPFLQNGWELMDLFLQH